ncbi:hypothetical protein H4S02_012368, partial [Coemansia sp. RSA 2611]
RRARRMRLRRDCYSLRPQLRAARMSASFLSAWLRRFPGLRSLLHLLRALSRSTWRREEAATRQRRTIARA